GGPPLLRAPGDRSRFWPVAEGGEHEGYTLAHALDLLSDDQEDNDPAPGEIARWSSYGLNDYLTSKGPSYDDPELGRIEPWRSLKRIAFPSSTVQFLMMTEGEAPGDPEYATSDHVHVTDWYRSNAGEDVWARRAAEHTELHARGGRAASPEGRATYGFLDGHAAVLGFGEVYRGLYENQFLPPVAH
ncbi:MAG TPA: hypothetical protein VFF69_01910, partial [Phycisphaerales bacterium]|nr:hypothetical protein [Phycisphaerales bacterium]